MAEGSVSSSSANKTKETKQILYRPAVLKESNLALFLPLGETENATSVQDWSINGLSGTVQGTISRFPGHYGSSFVSVDLQTIKLLFLIIAY